MKKYLTDLTAPEPSKRRAAAEVLRGSDERALYPLIKALSDENAGVQDAAMRSLIDIGGEVTAYMVLPLLRSDPHLRNTAAVILKEIGRPAVPLLRRLLSDRDDNIRKVAVDLIGEIGWCDHQDDFIGLLRGDVNPNVRASAARALGILRCGKALPELIQALTDEEWVCFFAMEALAAIGDDAAAVALESVLAHPSELLRYGAIEALGRLSSPLASTALMGHLLQARGLEKRTTLKSLVRAGITPHMSEVLDMLVDMLREGDWEEKLVAARGLADLRDEAALRHLVDLAGSLDRSDPVSEDRLFALREALSAFGCAEALGRLLEDPGIRYRGRVVVAEVLGDLKCTGVVRELTALMDASETEVRRAGARALAAIDSPASRRALVESLSDEDGHVRTTAIAALGKSGEGGAFRAILGRLASETYPDAIRESVRALVAMDEAAFSQSLSGQKRTVREAAACRLTHGETLIVLSRDEDPRVRAAAVAGFGRIGDRASAASLVEALRDPDPGVRRAAVTSMGDIGCCSTEIVSALDDGDLWVRVAAAKAAGAFGDRSLAAHMIRLSADPEVPVALAALESAAMLSGGDDGAALSPFSEHPDADVRKRAAELIEQSW